MAFDFKKFNDETDGGLQFWEQEFASEKTRKTAKGFSFDGGSSNVTKMEGGIYVYTNFKESSKGVTAVNYVMQRDNVDFPTASKTLFSDFGIDNTTAPDPTNLPLKIWTETTNEVGFYEVKYKKNVENAKIFAPFLTENLCNEYNFFEIEYYSTVRNVGQTNKKSLLTVTATAKYPIFGYKADGFVKIYEPKAVKNKDGFSSKHHFLGVKPARQIYGWHRFEHYQRTKKHVEDVFDMSIVDETDSSDNKPFDVIFIATGGSDGLNIASLGYDVVWLNSETEIINEFELLFLQSIATNVVYVPDLDKTGIAQAVTMGLMSKKHLKIKMLFPPAELKQNNKKDIADWVKMNGQNTEKTVRYKFDELLGQAKEFEFWDYNKKRGAFTVNNGKLLQFLHFNGFHVYKIPQLDHKTKRAIEEKIFIKIKDNIITKVSSTEVQIFVIDWLKKMFINLGVQEVFYKSVFFNDNNTIKALPETDVNTTKTSIRHQLYFFENTILNVTKDAVKNITYTKNEVQVWQKNIIGRKFFKKPQTTKITKNEAGVYDIEILDNSSKYLRLLINTSRFYWQKDLNDVNVDTNNFQITSKNLTDEQNLHQKQELLRKMYCLGHLLHEEKIKQKSYIVIGTDHAIGKNSRDNKGGSGKSAIISGVQSLVGNYVERNGRKLDKDTEKFIFTDIDEEVRVIHFDEMNPYYDTAKMFTEITSDNICNWKGGKMVYVPFKYFAKMAISMNSVPQNMTDSHQRRMLNFETSNYYHTKNEDFETTVQISDSFGGQQLWGDEYSQEDWALDDNFLIECLQFYLSEDKKPDVDGGNIVRRSQLQQMHPTCLTFLTAFWAELQDKNNDLKDTDELIFTAKKTGFEWYNKQKIHELYKAEHEKKAVSLADFKDNLNLFFECKIFFAKQKVNGIGRTVEHFRFLSNDAETINIDQNQTENNAHEAQRNIDFDDDDEPNLSF